MIQVRRSTVKSNIEHRKQKMLELIPFKAEHAEALGESADIAEVLEKSSVGYTAMDEEGNIVFSAGIQHRRAGVGNAWATFSGKCITKATLRTIRSIMDIVIAEFEFKRIRAVSIKGAGRIIEHLGFEKKRSGKNDFFVRVI